MGDPKMLPLPVLAAGAASAGGTFAAQVTVGKLVYVPFAFALALLYRADDSRHHADNVLFKHHAEHVAAVVASVEAITFASANCTKHENRWKPECTSVNIEKKLGITNTSMKFGEHANAICKRAVYATTDMAKYGALRRHLMYPIHAVS